MSYLDKDEVTIWEYKYNDLSAYRPEQRMWLERNIGKIEREKARYGYIIKKIEKRYLYKYNNTKTQSLCANPNVVKILEDKKEINLQVQKYNEILKEYNSLEEKLSHLESLFLNKELKRKELNKLKEEVKSLKVQIETTYYALLRKKNTIENWYSSYSFFIIYNNLEKDIDKLIEYELMESELIKIIYFLSININEEIDPNLQSINKLDLMKQILKKELLIEKVELKDPKKLPGDYVLVKQKNKK